MSRRFPRLAQALGLDPEDEGGHQAQGPSGSADRESLFDTIKRKATGLATLEPSSVFDEDYSPVHESVKRGAKQVGGALASVPRMLAGMVSPSANTPGAAGVSWLRSKAYGTPAKEEMDRYNAEARTETPEDLAMMFAGGIKAPRGTRNARGALLWEGPEPRKVEAGGFWKSADDAMRFYRDFGAKHKEDPIATERGIREVLKREGLLHEYTPPAWLK